MPKSKRNKDFHLTKVSKKTREHKEELFQKIRANVDEFQHCFVLSVDGMRNSAVKDVRRELKDSRMFFGKTKLMAKSLGLTPDTAYAPQLDQLATTYLHGAVGLLFTNRAPDGVVSYFASYSAADFARAGQVALRDFVVPAGVVYSAGGEVLPENDVPMAAATEPELRKLGMPVRLVKGKIVLGDEEGTGEGYRICSQGETLDSRQTRLLKLFDACLSEFKIKVLAYWSASSGEITEVEGNAMDVDVVGDAAGADDSG